MHFPASRTLRSVLFAAAFFGSPVLGNSVLAQSVPAGDTVPPSIEYGELYRDVELQAVFSDSKTFPDMVPDEAPGDVVAAYQASKDQPGFDLSAFVALHFTGPVPPGPTINPAAPGTALPAYVSGLWDMLTQSDQSLPAYSSLEPLPFPYVVPGGRFREVYYWDSYFTMLGLVQDGREDLVRNMVNNFAYEIDRFGFIPNGNRSYYLSRSQPPFFSFMVALLAAQDGDAVYLRYLPELQAEHDFWMEGADTLTEGDAHRRVVRLLDGTLLNRYWDDRAAPRDESYLEDVETASMSKRPAANVYRNLRAAAESGWDFSSRWLTDGKTLATIRTVSLLPVDLNSLLYHLETTLAHAYRLQGDDRRAASFDRAADQRATAMRALMWDAEAGAFTDYAWRKGEPTHVVTAATLAPLFCGVATPMQGSVVAATARKELLMPGGLATTLVESGQQWDQPNGWAPLQWIAVIGLNMYGETGLAKTIAGRWVQRNIDEYEFAGKLVEKYDVVATNGSLSGGGGEYATQIGFGWTNGVLLGLAALYPPLAEKIAAATPMPQTAAAQ